MYSIETKGAIMTLRKHCEILAKGLTHKENDSVMDKEVIGVKLVATGIVFETAD